MPKLLRLYNFSSCWKVFNPIFNMFITLPESLFSLLSKCFENTYSKASFWSPFILCIVLYLIHLPLQLLIGYNLQRDSLVTTAALIKRPKELWAQWDQTFFVVTLQRAQAKYYFFKESWTFKNKNPINVSKYFWMWLHKGFEPVLVLCCSSQGLTRLGWRLKNTDGQSGWYCY